LIGPQRLLVEFADLFQGRLKPSIVLQLPADLRNLFSAQADVANPPLGVTDGQHPNGMSFPAVAFRAALTMADRTLQQTTAQDICEVRKFAQQSIASPYYRLMFHY
jgi:hypothetical protein